jgi:membrane carboxypeptidase/penicillin-binding protein PbpC
MLLDIPRRFPGASEGLIYQPANPDASFSGPISLRQAAAQNLLPPIVQIADNHGLTNILRTARRLGINTLNEGLYDLSLLERGGLVAPLDVAYAYSVLSSQGSMYGVPVPARATGLRNRDPVAVLKIQDSEGRVLWEYQPEPWRVNLFSDAPELGYLVNNIFSDYAIRQQKFGTASPLLTSRPSASVTALSSDGRDNWTVGYSPQRVVGVHLTRADSLATGLDGYAPQAASTLWRSLFDQVHVDLTPVEWPRPSQVAEITVCERSGLLPHDNCPTRREVVIAGIQPAQQDTFWQAVEINSQTRQRATANTPAALRVSETFFVPPDTALEWWRANRQPLPPEDYDNFSRPDNAPFSSTSITRPEPLAWVRGAVEIRGTVNQERLRFYQMAYGAGVNPTEWIAIGASQSSMPESGALGIWDTTGLDGVYTLELAAVLTDGTRERAVVQVRVDNVPPTVAVSAVELGKVYRFPADSSIPLTAITADNLALERVEMYAGGRLVATLTDAPYAYSHPISSVGNITFNAVAFDAAGNQSESTPLIVEVIR